MLAFENNLLAYDLQISISRPSRDKHDFVNDREPFN